MPALDIETPRQLHQVPILLAAGNAIAVEQAALVGNATAHVHLHMWQQQSGGQQTTISTVVRQHDHQW